jgi:branched-chain amino acid transport system ATP-binding protein
MTLLIANQLRKSFGGVHAVRNVDLAVDPGARQVILGPNGAGKTTLFNLLSGTILPDSGTILFNGQQIGTMPAHRRARLGISRTFQIINLFRRLSVKDNVLLALLPYRLGLKHFAPNRKELQDARDVAADLLTTWGLYQERDQRVDQLSYGKQRALEIVLALARKPTLLLLDEPTVGLEQNEIAGLIKALQKLPKDVAALMIEHDMAIVNEFAERITVLHRGHILKEADARSVLADPEVQAVYARKATLAAT